MSTEDYLIRQFRLLGLFLARIAELRELGQYKKALVEIDQQLSGWTGMTPGEVSRFNASSLQQMLPADSNDNDYLAGLAELVYLKVILLFDNGEFEAAVALAHLSLSIYQQLEHRTENFSYETQQRISQLKTLISGA